MEITESSIAPALEGLWVYARNRDGTHHAQVIADEDTAASLWEKLAAQNLAAPVAAPGSGDLERAYVINGDDLRIALSGRNGSPPLVPNPRDVAAYILDWIARPLDAKPGGAVDAHICCDHAAADPEVSFLAGVVRALDEMGDLAVARVMAYLSDRYPADN